MRRYVLGPVVLCFLIIGFIGADFGQAAQARTADRKELKSSASHHPKAHKKVSAAEKKAHKGKKIVSAKKKAKHASLAGHKHHKKKAVLAKSSKRKKIHRLVHAKHKSHAKRHLHAKAKTRAHAHLSASFHSSKPLARINHVADYDLPAPQPSELLLEKSCPGFDRRMENGLEPDGLTLKILESAYSCLGTPYRAGGTTPEGFDCSGFVRYIFRENGIQLARSSREQALEGKPVQLNELKPGDLIFFKMHQGRKAKYHIDHVGLYVGKGQFIHASNNPRAREIKMDALERGHYLPKIVEARRILDYTQ